MVRGGSINERLGNRYELIKSIGSGGMSVVYQARDSLLERLVAIKILREDYTNDPGFKDSFKQEAQSAAKLSHMNIVTVHDFGLDHGRLYIVMEFVPGINLKSLIRQKGQFSISDCLTLMVQACSGIGYAHRAGFVHCDVKPQNMLVTPDERLKVTDFGIARVLSNIHPDEHHNIVWGSPQYFSPEQAAGLAPSPASDVYSLGIILYEMLCGRLPFTSDDPVELTRLHRYTMPQSPRDISPNIPVQLEKILMKVLAKEPSARYRTADQLGKILFTYGQQSNIFDASRSQLNLPGHIQDTTQPFASQNTPNTTTKAKTHSIPSNLTEKPPMQYFKRQNGLDLFTIALGLITLITLGGLIPFWLYIYLSVFSN